MGLIVYLGRYALRHNKGGSAVLWGPRTPETPPQHARILAVVLAAVPTAYSGASGSLSSQRVQWIFERLMAAGASKRMALAATAMSGSLGVVLRPCLVVVLIAVLNKQVTTR